MTFDFLKKIFFFDEIDLALFDMLLKLNFNNLDFAIQLESLSPIAINELSDNLKSCDGFPILIFEKSNSLNFSPLVSLISIL